MEFVLGGVAAMGACFFTNPLEVIKTRLQLQGELQARGQHARHYRNVPHAVYTIVKADGILALQSGLIPALWVQFFLNGLRLGIYQLGEVNGLILDKNGNTILWKSIGFGSIGAVVGSFASSPFFLVKTHLQSKSASAVAVGHQHKYNGMMSGLKEVYSKQGITGLWRGGTAIMSRAAIGGPAQLTSFVITKEWLENKGFFKNQPLITSFMASMIGGIALSVIMTPFDLVTTRLYNQGVGPNGKGLLYNGYMDCVIKVWKKESFYGFYKGIGPSYLRLGPHTVLCLMFWDELKQIENNFVLDINKR